MVLAPIVPTLALPAFAPSERNHRIVQGEAAGGAESDSKPLERAGHGPRETSGPEQGSRGG